MTVEQDRAEALLERRDLTTHRRLAEFENVAGSGEATVLGDRQKNS